MKTQHLVCAVTLLFVAQSSLLASSYYEVGLVANNATVAAQFGAPVIDPLLINPWGMSFSTGSPFWVSNQGTGTSTLYSGAGVKAALTVTIPATTAGPQGPTGQVFNSTTGFAVGGSASAFIFDTLAGTINAWNNVPTGNTVATTVVTTSGAVYTGLALASATTSGVSANYLYAANFAATTGGGINVFDSTFTQVNSTTFAGKFIDPNAVTGYSPYNVQLVGNDLYVEYAQRGTGGAITGAGLGYVDVFDTSGNFVKRLTGPGGALNAPWGVTMAPADFGSFSNDILVGNFGNGLINAFDPNTGQFLGMVSDSNGMPIDLPGLWAIDFRTNGGGSSVPNGLYFAAGIAGPTNQSDGLFGYLAPVPEPSAYALAALGLAALAARAAARRRTARS